jgi:hypothetical protein
MVWKKISTKEEKYSTGSEEGHHDQTESFVLISVGKLGQQGMNHRRNNEFFSL